MSSCWVVGPCSMESPELFFKVGEELSTVMRGRDWYYKASFDKANRTHVDSPRGPGLERGLKMFRDFRRAFPDVRLTTDVHECYQVRELAGVVDCIQIPAFLCRQTDLLSECGRYFNLVNVKKGQWISPANIVGAAGKVRSRNPSAQVWISDRGTQFGYEQLVIDFRSVEVLLSAFDRVLLDCTHATQYSKPDGRLSGCRRLAESYALSAPIFGYSGVFAEIHPNPADAISDSESQIALSRLPAVLDAHDEIAHTLLGFRKGQREEKLSNTYTNISH